MRYTPKPKVIQSLIPYGVWGIQKRWWMIEAGRVKCFV